ncbi:limbic system-associated membrane protein-like isoform X4 [Portunus trituberculatus]|uniref:limbic system-associated membrane protein-like isoform X4 n=1 Tax=Portunus trituberculatus TaxID=210409 RepID=UPI001E1CC044|nr:limbic system-associated membrane protein-like isoform X4 [Portunus trituberculatus]
MKIRVLLLLLGLLAGGHVRPCASADGAVDSLPRFLSPIENVTVSVGRDARLSCVVENLDNYKVAWIYKGTGGRTVLTVATQVITKNPRISAAQEAQAWVLTVTKLTRKDQGVYMCQVNTKPVRKQLGFIRVVVPPTIDDLTSSKDETTEEGGNVSFTCAARGDPQPVIRWIREGGLKFTVNSMSAVEEHLGRKLTLHAVQRNSSGAYLCIASNGVPPSVSKRIMLSVNFPPQMVLDGGREATELGVVMESEVQLRCRFMVRPFGKVSWYLGPRGRRLADPGSIHTTVDEPDSGLWTSVLTVRVRRAQDLGQYRCVVSNSLGMEETVFYLHGETTTSPLSSEDFPGREYNDILRGEGGSGVGGGGGGATDDKQRKNPLRYFDLPTSAAPPTGRSSPPLATLEVLYSELLVCTLALVFVLGTS